MGEEMKNLIIKNIIRFALIMFVAAISISCVDSLNSPYPGTSINNKSGDSITEPIAPPTNLKIVEFTEGKVFGLWLEDNSNNEDGFQVWRRNGTSEDFIKITTVGILKNPMISILIFSSKPKKSINKEQSNYFLLEK